MPDLRKEYKLPNESILDKVYDDELFDQRNDEFIESVIQGIQESFYAQDLKLNLIGISPGYNSTVLKYEYFDLEKDKFELPNVKVEKLISKADGSEKLTLSDIRLVEPEESGCVEFTVIAEHQWLKEFPFGKLYENAKPEENQNFCFYGDLRGSACYENINGCKLITIAGDDEKNVTETTKNLLLSTAFYFKPSELKFIIFDQADNFDCFNGTASMYFGKVEKDLKLLYETLIYLNELATQRKSRLEQAKMRDIECYNASREDKMEYIWVVLNDFAKVREFYGPSARKLCKYLADLTKLGVTTGIHFVISSPIILGDPFSPEIRVASSIRIALKIENTVGGFMALGKRLPTSLSDRADAYLYHFGRDIKRIIPAGFREDEALRICHWLNTCKDKDFHEKQYEYVKQLFEKDGLLGAKNTPEFRRLTLIKESLRAGLQRGKINQVLLQDALCIESDEAKSIMNELIEKNYITRNGFYYFVTISEEEFEKLFGEKV